MAGKALEPVQPPVYNDIVILVTGNIYIEAPADISGSGTEDRSVDVSVRYGTWVFSSGEQRLSLRSVACPAGSAGSLGPDRKCRECSLA